MHRRRLLTVAIALATGVFVSLPTLGASAGWKGGTTATTEVDNSKATDSAGDVGAVYKGLAFGSNGSGNRLYASNFRFGTVDVFDGSFNPAGSFTDPKIPAGYAPFGIQNLGG